MTITDEAYDRMVAIRIRAFADKAKEITDAGAYDDLTFSQKLELCVEAELDARFERRCAKRNREARFAEPAACIENVTYLPTRSLKRETLERYAGCSFITDARNIIVLSATGAGKSYISQAIGNAACRQSYSVRYVRHPDLNKELAIARRNGELYECMDRFIKCDLLILDDLFLAETSMKATTDLLEIVESRINRRSLILASQLTPEEWHLRIDTKIIADALLDRVVHNSYLLEITGPNMREYYSEIA